MNKTITTSLAMWLIITTGSVFAMGHGGKGQGKMMMKESDHHTVDFSSYEISVLTEDEKTAIIHMREEEKLARDVYQTLGKTTDSKVFQNIPKSEGRHMDVFDQLIDRYGLKDPVKDESVVGTFTDPLFTDLFAKLTEKGKLSDADAFEVGAMVEDINMANLMKYGMATEKADLKLAYDTLLVQSKNHMSAFVRQLDRLGKTFEPTHINAQQLSEAVDAGAKHMEDEAKEMGGHALEIQNELNESVDLIDDIKIEVQTTPKKEGFFQSIMNFFKNLFK